VSAATVLRFRDQAFDRFFANKRYLDIVAQKFGWETRRHIEAMAKHKLSRRLLDDNRGSAKDPLSPHPVA
jgi:anaerobic magnesium-protoporphyrin IX monomethyl ester cyclase